MGYMEKGSKDLTHILFGGSTIQNEFHKCYYITVADLKDNYNCTFQVLDQNVIYGNLPRLRKGPWLKDLKIWITDYGECQPEIELLIGADICGQLFTGNMYELECGLTTIETKLGWIIEESSKRNRKWICISDPIETKSRKELEIAAFDYFQKTVTKNENGRFEVHLPWLETKDYLQQNKSVAERRCISTSIKLKAEGRYEDYDAVLKEWEDSKIIELVPESEIGEASHYLPTTPRSF
ncbi:uncharacterized protein [Parasteatoda tepidariorum]|uniref:uncharacterized protein n=1 Tax=Parasteatoda tepidariorum TaxID=114398 RepID=UPI0039BD010A